MSEILLTTTILLILNYEKEQGITKVFVLSVHVYNPQVFDMTFTNTLFKCLIRFSDFRLYMLYNCNHTLYIIYL